VLGYSHPVNFEVFGPSDERHVILAIPFSALRAVDYTQAEFDALKMRAIEELGAGKNGKLHVQFTSRFKNTHGPWGVSNG
jgi:monoamine oxidase